MPRAIHQFTAVDDSGNIMADADVTVRVESNANRLADLYSDRDGNVPVANPIRTDANGFVQFYTLGGFYKITITKGAYSQELRYVAIGTAAAYDVEDILSQNFGAVVPGLAGRAAYNGKAQGFSVLVESSSGNSNLPTVYIKKSAVSADWSGGYTYGGARMQAALTFELDAQGAVIATGPCRDQPVPFNLTVLRWTITADGVGDIDISIWKDTFANWPPTVADKVTGSSPIRLSGAQSAQDSTLTGWSKNWTQGDVLRFNVDSSNSITKCFVTLFVLRT